MIATAPSDIQASGLCDACGIPLDSQYFDDSSVQDVPRLGEEIILARFELPPQYCGVLQYFAQYTDAFGVSPAAIATPSVEWRLVVTNHALFPYLNLRRIINPWGYGSYPLNLRLDEDAIIDLRVRGVRDDGQLGGTAAVGPILLVGGRIVGRFWYNECYGGK
jgi:hypothetical protein